MLQKFIWNKKKRPQISSAILRKKNKVGGIIIPDVKLYYKATVIKSLVLAQEQTNRSMEQNREPRNRPHNYNQLIFDKGAKTIQRSKDTLCNK